MSMFFGPYMVEKKEEKRSIFSPRAKAACDAPGYVFQPVSARILRLHFKCHMSYITVLAVYAPTNPPNSTSEAFNDQL